MRRGTGYVRTLEESEEYGSRRLSLKRLFGPKKSPNRGGGSSERPLLFAILSSDAEPTSGVQSVASTLDSVQSSSVVSPEHRPEKSQQQQDMQQPQTRQALPQERQLETSSQHTPPMEDEVIQGVKEKLKTSSPKKEPKKQSKTPKSDEMTKVRAALERPFGRSNLPPHLASNWVVEVSPAEWDADEERWKYRILVQRRSLEELDDSMTTAFSWRSLEDFIWLEQALRAEYHGALLLPLLSIALGTSDVASFTQQDVDSSLLKDWLNDVLNGIRGQGELVLNQEPVDMAASEAMEAFLYRNTGPLMSPGQKSLNASGGSQLDHSLAEPETFVESLWAKPFNCLPIDTMCGPSPSPETQKSIRTPLHMMACSSRALGNTESFHVQDSFADFDPEPIQSSSLAIHSELLEAERELCSTYRQAAMCAMDKGRILIEEETMATVAWKRFAISLAALYSYEKDIESLRVEDTKQKKRPQHRKLGRENVDELLRLMTKQKTDRSAPALRALDAMLSAYVGDLSAVSPAFKAYSDAIMQLSNLEDPPVVTADGANSTTTNGDSSKQRSINSASSWQDQLRTLATSTLKDVKKQMAGESAISETTSTTQSTEGDVILNQKRAFEARVLGNERLLKDSLTALCRGTPIRVARMAFRFFQTEMTQAGLLKSCAYSMRTKVNIINRDALAEMIERHKRESVEDSKTELDLVHRIITIEDIKLAGSARDLEPEQVVENDDGFNIDAKKALLRTEAMELVRARVGRWDSKVGLAIVKAVGAEEGEVRVDETTRELRIVRKFAIGLREQLNRCREALKSLKGVVYHGDPDATDEQEYSGEGNYLRDARRQFVDDITDVFSGALVNAQTTPRKPKSASNSMSVLSRAGIELEDPAGWSSAVITATKSQSKRKIVPRKRRGRCGELTVSYTDLKNSGTEKLLETLSELLDSYSQRLESIESYVYMQCVGIQLEKHFSQHRSEALAAFEKKTDISTAISIAQRKKLPLLVSELETKMSAVANVTHTDVKKLKEIHLVSKNLKSEISALATRRFLRLRETSTERVIGLLTVWAQHEEDAASAEIQALGEVVAEVERQFASVDFSSDGISHTFFGRSSRRKPSV